MELIDVWSFTKNVPDAITFDIKLKYVYLYWITLEVVNKTKYIYIYIYVIKGLSI